MAKTSQITSNLRYDHNHYSFLANKKANKGNSGPLSPWQIKLIREMAVAFGRNCNKSRALNGPLDGPSLPEKQQQQKKGETCSEG